MKTIGVRFRRASKIYTFSANEVECKLGDCVVVETERGMALGRVAMESAEPESPPKQPLKKVLRLAEERDLRRDEKNEEMQQEAAKACSQLIAEKGLPMKLLNVEYLFDRSKVIFFFSAEGRVDFRELVRDLARRFHTRIEMRQVGVRDEAKMVGGVGCCGRELCCATWLSDFAPISVRMAKSQNISLNPAKISGICGRLMCCLAYEHKMYEELSRGMPKMGKRVATPWGEGKVIRRNTLEGSFVLFTDKGEVEIDLQEFLKAKEAGETQPLPAQPKKQDRSRGGGGPCGRRGAKPDEKRDRPSGGKEAEKPGEKQCEKQGDKQQPQVTGEEGHKPKRTGRRRRRRRKRSSQAQGQGQAQGREKKSDG